MVDLLRNRAIALAGFLLIPLHTDVLAEGGEYSYRYHPMTPAAEPFAGYRWRPQEAAQKVPAQETSRQFPGGDLMPYDAHVPPDRPSASYRPIINQQITPPQVGGFRFREISSAERSGYAKTDELPFSGFQGSGLGVPPKFRDLEETQQRWSSKTEQRFKFRPDKKFPEYSGERASSYRQDSLQTYHPHYLTPVFRKKNDTER